MTRRNAREIIMQMLYECDFHQEEDRERIFHERIKIIQEEAVEEGQQKGSNKAIFKFMESEYYGVLEHLAEIDELIAKSATNWSMDRIAKVDHMILRLAIYELKWAEDIPRKVIANEAVEIAKMYSTDKSPKFINGVIGNIIKLIEV